MLRSLARACHEQELQRNAEPAAHRFSDEGESRRARAGTAENVGGDAALSANPKSERGSRAIRPPRRPAFCEWRRPHGNGTEQDSQRFRGQIPDHAGQTRALHPRLGLPWATDRIQSSERIPGPFASRGPQKIGSIRAKVCRYPARAIQATRCLR